MTGACLFYVVGASGRGKENLIHYARTRLRKDLPVVFAHRYITRPVRSRTENHVALTTEEFLLRRSRGLFAMEWESRGFLYGVGSEIHYWLAAGLGVVVNGSRHYLPEALQRYSDMKIVWIQSGTEVAAARIAREVRELAAAAASRTVRTTLANETFGPPVLHLENDGVLENAGERFVSVLATGAL